MRKKEENSSDEECKNYIVNLNTKQGQDKFFNSEALVNAIKKQIFQLGNLNQSGKTSPKNKANIIHKRNGSDISDISIKENQGDILDTKGEGNNLKELKQGKIKSKDKKEDTKNIKSENKTNLKKNNNEFDQYSLFIYEDKDKNKKIYAFQKNNWREI